MSEHETRSLHEVVASVGADLGRLVSTEFALLRTELSGIVSRLRKAAVGAGLGAVLLLGSYFCILAAIVIALSYVMPAAWAALVVGVATGLVGGSLLLAAAKGARPEELTPKASMRELEKDVRVMRERAS